MAAWTPPLQGIVYRRPPRRLIQLLHRDCLATVSKASTLTNCRHPPNTEGVAWKAAGFSTCSILNWVLAADRDHLPPHSSTPCLLPAPEVRRPDSLHIDQVSSVRRGGAVGRHRSPDPTPRTDGVNGSVQNRFLHTNNSRIAIRVSPSSRHQHQHEAAADLIYGSTNPTSPLPLQEDSWMTSFYSIRLQLHHTPRRHTNVHVKTSDYHFHLRLHTSPPLPSFIPYDRRRAPTTPLNSTPAVGSVHLSTSHR